MRFFLFSLVCVVSIARAEPQMPATFEELCNVESVVMAEYVSYRAPEGGVNYFHPPIAQFKLKHVAFGAPVPERIDVAFEFHDGSPCLEPEGFRFSSRDMPQAGESFFLFLNQKQNGVYLTYRGDLGRVRSGSLASLLLNECGKHRRQVVTRPDTK